MWVQLQLCWSDFSVVKLFLFFPLDMPATFFGKCLSCDVISFLHLNATLHVHFTLFLPSLSQVNLAIQEKEQYMNVTRWFDHIQHYPGVRHHLPHVAVLRNRIYTGRHHWDLIPTHLEPLQPDSDPPTHSPQPCLVFGMFISRMAIFISSFWIIISAFMFSAGHITKPAYSNSRWNCLQIKEKILCGYVPWKTASVLNNCAMVCSWQESVIRSWHYLLDA